MVNTDWVYGAVAPQASQRNYIFFLWQPVAFAINSLIIDSCLSFLEVDRAVEDISNNLSHRNSYAVIYKSKSCCFNASGNGKLTLIQDDLFSVLNASFQKVELKSLYLKFYSVAQVGFPLVIQNQLILLPYRAALHEFEKDAHAVMD